MNYDDYLWAREPHKDSIWKAEFNPFYHDIPLVAWFKFKDDHTRTATLKKNVPSDPRGLYKSLGSPWGDGHHFVWAMGVAATGFLGTFSDN